MSKYGSPSFDVFLVDGYNLLGAKVQSINHKVESKQQRTDGLGDDWEASNPTGMRMATLAQGGAFFDDTTNGMHDAWKTTFQRTEGNVYSPARRIMCLAWAGNVIGRIFRGAEGLFGLSYEVLAKVGNLTNANAAYTVSGQVNEGVILQEWATRTDDWNTASEGNSVDNAASSASGGYGYLQVSGYSGPNSIVVKIQHAADGGGGGATWVDLVTFTTITSTSGAPQAQRIAVAGTVNRWLRLIVTGMGNVSASASTSASISPSISASISSSASRSPSSSLSPSRSQSASPSASLSPSASTSRSPSSSISPSTSLSPSPSSSLSPSASASPSAGAANASSLTLFAGFARS